MEKQANPGHGGHCHFVNRPTVLVSLSAPANDPIQVVVLHMESVGEIDPETLNDMTLEDVVQLYPNRICLIQTVRENSGTDEASIILQLPPAQVREDEVYASLALGIGPLDGGSDGAIDD